MRVVFMGTPNFAATILSYVCEQHQVVGVFTRPDAIRGRGKSLVPSPVKECAQAHEVPVYEYATLKHNDAAQVIRNLHPDILCVAAYGCIVPQEILDIAPYGCLNVHASLLPRWRGAAPVERAILAGDELTGVCIMRMAAGLDTGDYCLVRSLEIGQTSANILTAALAELGASALLVALAQIEQGSITWIQQDESQATYAPKIEKGELDIRPDFTAEQALRHIQASSETHPCHCSIALKSVTVLSACAVADNLPEIGSSQMVLSAGQVAFVGKRLFLGCADAPIEILEVKPAGKQAMDAKAFAAGIQGIKQDGALWQGIFDA